MEETTEGLNTIDKDLIEHSYILSEEQFYQELPELKEWMGSLVSGFYVIFSKSKKEEYDYAAQFYSEKHEYVFRIVKPATPSKRGYIGGSIQNRAPEPGEGHTRGRDLSDGKYEEVTVKKIFKEILDAELQRIGRDVNIPGRH